MAQVVHIPHIVEQDENGAWRASGDDATREEAITDLDAALLTLLEVVGPPSELTVTVNIP